MSARPFRLWQDHDAAADRRLPGTDDGRNPGRRPAGIVKGADAAPRTAQHVHDFSELRAVAAHDGDGKHHLRAEAAQDGSRYDRQEVEGDSDHYETGAAGATLSRRVVRR